MQKTTLLIMAAGMGSRFGSLKQITPLGPKEKTLLHYTIYDAVEAGFNKIVFIIRESFEKEFKDFVGKYAEDKCETHYCFQSMDKLPGNMPPIDREKPWGTAHAIWSAKDVIDEPFAVLNADDFYGSDAFVKAYNFLSDKKYDGEYCLIGYKVEPTLSSFGTVSRGVCITDENDYLTSVTEYTKIKKDEKGVISDEVTGDIIANDKTVSMNFWGFYPSLFDEIEKQFVDFYQLEKDNPKSEIYIPKVVDKIIRDKRAKVKVIPTDAEWFGVTYKEDKPIVNDKLNRFHEKGLYKNI